MSYNEHLFDAFFQRRIISFCSVLRQVDHVWFIVKSFSKKPKSGKKWPLVEIRHCQFFLPQNITSGDYSTQKKIATKKIFDFFANILTINQTLQ